MLHKKGMISTNIKLKTQTIAFQTYGAIDQKTFQTKLATDMIRVTGDSTIKSEVDEANLDDVIKGYFSQKIRQ
jgi:hypothetical protein